MRCFGAPDFLFSHLMRQGAEADPVAIVRLTSSLLYLADYGDRTAKNCATSRPKQTCLATVLDAATPDIPGHELPEKDMSVQGLEPWTYGLKVRCSTD